MIFLLIFSLMVQNGFGSEEASRRQQESAQTAQKTAPYVIPGFVTDSPPETALGTISALDAAGQNLPASGKMMQEMTAGRPYFVIDSQTDPVFKENKTGVQTYTRQTCLESKPEQDFTCHKTLITPTIHIEPAKYAHYWCRAGHHRPDDPSCRAKQYYNPARLYQAEKVTITSEDWSNTCGALEDKAKTGHCRLIQTTCPGGPQTREVAGTLTTGETVTRPLTKDCWRRVLTYRCGSSDVSLCADLRRQGCDQLGSTCRHKTAGQCTEWEQTYRCPVKQKGDEKAPIKPNPSLSVPESVEFTTPPDDGPNTEMADALAKLSIFDSIQQDIRSTATADTLTIFKGQNRSCTIAFGNFKNCCVKSDGWGISLNLSSCSGDERDLAERQQRRLCVEVGTFCAEKLPGGICLRKKKSYCCFPNKLSRILHEQGRAQLGLGWGDAKSPECRGFRPEELARISFDRLDLREVFDDVLARTKTPVPAQTQEHLGRRVSDMTRGLGENL